MGLGDRKRSPCHRIIFQRKSPMREELGERPSRIQAVSLWRTREAKHRRRMKQAFRHADPNRPRTSAFHPIPVIPHRKQCDVFFRRHSRFCRTEPWHPKADTIRALRHEICRAPFGWKAGWLVLEANSNSEPGSPKSSRSQPPKSRVNARSRDPSSRSQFPVSKRASRR